MIRIYLTEDGVEGYHEGCSCCSYKEGASTTDIDNLISRMEDSVKRLRLLSFLITRYGDTQLATWYATYKNIERLRRNVDAGNKYKKNHNISGSYFKECYDHLEENLRHLEQAELAFKKTPAVFRKYVERE